MAATTSGATAGSTSGSTAAPEATAEPLVLVKRQAPADEPTGCVLYRYGTFATQLEIVREWGVPVGRSRGGPNLP